MSTRIELRVTEDDGELVIYIDAPGLLPRDATHVEASVAGGILEIRLPQAATHVPGFHPEASPV